MHGWLELVVFGVVYLGMLLGGLPRLWLDRTGVALLGAIAIVGLGDLTPEAAAQAIHLPTILLLFGFMVISAQMRLGGFYAAVTRRIAALPVAPPVLLAVVVAAAAGLSAVFSNDIVCLAMAPVLVQACVARRLDPVPFLLALACAANIGSAATLIGNPQNMLIGEVLGLSFGGYALDALPVVAASLVLLWALLRRSLATVVGTGVATPVAAADAAPAFDAWQSAKGLAVAGALMLVFLATDWPRDVATLAGNLLIVGSIANIIVVDAARRQGVVIDWRRDARTGVPVTLATLAVTAAWLAWRLG